MASAFLHQIPAETLQVLLASLAPRPSTENDALASLFTRGDVVELQGPPGAAISHFLYHSIISCILPTTYQSHLLGGGGKAAFLYATDHVFDLDRFKRLMHSRLSPLLQSLGVPPHHLEIITDLSMKRFHVFHPNSSSQLAASLLLLPSYTASHLPNTEMGIIAVDSLSAFYWTDRFAIEQARSQPRSSPSHVSVFPLYNIASALEKIRMSFYPLILLTNWGLDVVHSSAQSPSFPMYKQHLHPFPTPFDEKNSTADKATVTSPLTLTVHITFFPVSRHTNIGYNVSITPSTGQEPTAQVDCLVRRLEHAPERICLQVKHGNIQVER
ncbi:hypothetical protein BDZ89DRAFT_979950 [Hymenopellis radicata]|nr:hypothetical protein BDZ89DRAFT_979950 [Hymenopellis radicata]